MKKYNIIDCHCHIYPDAIVGKAVEAIEGFYDYRYKGFDGKKETMLKNGNSAGVDHYIVFSVATTPHQVHSINSFISDCVKNSGGVFTGLGTLHPYSDTLRDDFEELISLGLKGVKLHPDFQKIPIDDERCQEIYRLCSQRVPVLLHTGDYRYDYSNPERMRLVLEKFPDCTFIGAHFGGWSVWEEAVKKLSPYRNFYVDTSSSLSDISTETARELIRCYTPDRILYGTDFPLGDSAKEISLVKKAVTDEAALEKIFYRNASELFDIKL
ncbi:MAG: amidohydrolase [Clostridia bacterium]|nr:amidohydrolase [Clostridia bacterium]